MAKVKLSDAAYVTWGYGQVEPNHLSAQRNGEIYAQLPAEKTIQKLENGQFAKYDYANGKVNFTGKGPWMLVYNEVKVYKDRQGDADFAMIKDNYIGNVLNDLPTYAEDDFQVMVPRLFATHPGDHYTTNTINETELAVGDLLTPGADGFLAKAGADAATEEVWQVAKVYTMPDSQKGVKIIKIK